MLPMAKLINYRLSGTASTLNGTLLPLAPVLPLAPIAEVIAAAPLEAALVEADPVEADPVEAVPLEAVTVEANQEEVELESNSTLPPTVEPPPIEISAIAKTQPTLATKLTYHFFENTPSKIKLLAWVVPLIMLFGLGAIPVFDKPSSPEAISPAITPSHDASWLGEPVVIQPRASGYHQIIRY